MTKNDFLAEYEAEIKREYGWATADPVKLAAFMASVRTTLKGPDVTWAYDGSLVHRVWHRLGGKGKPTLKQLRELA